MQYKDNKIKSWRHKQFDKPGTIISQMQFWNYVLQSKYVCLSLLSADFIEGMTLIHSLNLFPGKQDIQVNSLQGKKLKACPVCSPRAQAQHILW